MNYTYSFEKLQVWHDSRELVKMIYSITRKFPVTEKYGLVNQVNRCAISVVSNIAEGSGRTSAKDQAHFYQIAFSSIIELLTQLIIGNDLVYLSETDLNNARSLIEKISNKLNTLRKKCLEGLIR